MLCLSLKTNCFIKNAFCRDLRRHRSHFGEEVARSVSTIPTSSPSQIPKNRWGPVRNQKPIRGLCAHRGGSERNRGPESIHVVKQFYLGPRCVCVCYYFPLQGDSPVPRGGAALPHGSVLHSPACTPSPISRPPRPACIWPSGQSSVVHVSLCRCVSCAFCENLRAPNRTPRPSRCALPAARCLHLQRQ
jgi:hypothetical protein